VRPILITSGATRNPIDAIRYLSAQAGGSTAIRIASCLEPERNITLLASREVALRGAGEGITFRCEEFSSTRDLMTRMKGWIERNPGGIVVHSAAVGDYEIATDTPDGNLETKIPSGQAEWVLRLRPTPKILDHLKSWSPDLFVVSFKAAAPGTDDEELLARARAQQERTNSDLVLANVLGRLTSRVLILGEKPTWFETREAALATLIETIRETG
jgi:phosphopantothenoylcysteine synthetase/decarboxylase